MIANFLKVSGLGMPYLQLRDTYRSQHMLAHRDALKEVHLHVHCYPGQGQSHDNTSQLRQPCAKEGG